MRRSRREFLADVGRGMILAGIGPALAADLGLGRAWAEEAPEALTFGNLESLVCLMQETAPGKLLEALTDKVRGGTSLDQLVAAAALANARTFGGEDYVGFHTMMALWPAYQMSRELPEDRRALPILVSSIEQATMLTRDPPDNFLKLAQKLWPGALTIIVQASHKVPLKVTANKGRVALRWPNARVACAIIEQVGSPITGTSANISGYPSCSNAHELVQQLGERLPLILDSGDTGSRVSSTIVNLEGEDWKIVRPGQITEDEIEKVLADS